MNGTDSGLSCGAAETYRNVESFDLTGMILNNWKHQRAYLTM